MEALWSKEFMVLSKNVHRYKPEKMRHNGLNTVETDKADTDVG